MIKYTKGDYNQQYCEIYYDDEFVGDVRTDDADKFIKLLNDLHEQNLSLKAQLYVNPDKGVCSICKHHYLSKLHKDMDKYYVSKCRKEHEECSKESLRYCEDFELKVKE